MLRAYSLGAALACAVLLISCGEDEPPPPPDLPADRMLDRAIARVPASGRASIDLEAEYPRLTSGPISAQLEGPFALGAGIPSFDLEGEAQAAGFGVDGSLVSTGGDAYVVFFGENYRVGRDRVAALALRTAGVDPSAWFGAPRHAGDEEVEGEDAYRIEAPLDSERVAADLGRIGLAAAGAGGLEGSRAIVWVGVDDGIVRRIRLSSEALDLDAVLSDLGEPQEIEPPPGGGFQPIEQLLERIPGL
ncbi:MAG: hypothetical protein ACRDL6_00110 [Solirubrobacterales bacterium]